MRLVDADQVIYEMKKRCEVMGDDKSLYEASIVETALNMYGKTVYAGPSHAYEENASSTCSGMNKDNCSSCKLCRYLLTDTAETPSKGYYCVNEASEHFGKVVSVYEYDETGCEKYERTDPERIRQMSLKDALGMLLLPDCETSYPQYHFDFGKEGEDFICYARFFESNQDMLKWRDALDRCILEFIDLIKKEELTKSDDSSTKDCYNGRKERI